MNVVEVVLATRTLVDYLDSSPDGAIKFVGFAIQGLKCARDALMWGAIIGGAAAGYLVLLLYLPRILELDKNGATKTQPVGEPGSAPKNGRDEKAEKSTDTPAE
jgi:hypothetical protein